MVAPPLSHGNFVFEAKHELLRAEAGKSELAECGELTPAMLCELTGSQDPAPQLAGQLPLPILPYRTSPMCNPGMAELASAATFACAWRAAASARWHTSVTSPAIVKIASSPIAHKFE